MVGSRRRSRLGLPAKFFLRGTLLQGVRPATGDSSAWVRAQSLDEWMVGAAEYFAESPFYERQVATQVTIDGPLATVLSRYESLRHPDSLPYQTGVNAFVFARTPDGWQIVSLTNHDTD